MANDTETDSDGRRLGVGINGEICKWRSAVNDTLPRQQTPARTPAGHEELSLPALPEAWPGQQCPAVAAAEPAAWASIGPCRPMTSTISSAVSRRFMDSVYTANNPEKTTPMHWEREIREEFPGP